MRQKPQQSFLDRRNEEDFYREKNRIYCSLLGAYDIVGADFETVIENNTVYEIA